MIISFWVESFLNHSVRPVCLSRLSGDQTFFDFLRYWWKYVCSYILFMFSLQIHIIHKCSTTTNRMIVSIPRMPPKKKYERFVSVLPVHYFCLNLGFTIVTIPSQFQHKVFFCLHVVSSMGIKSKCKLIPHHDMTVSWKLGLFLKFWDKSCSRSIDHLKMFPKYWCSTGP